VDLAFHFPGWSPRLQCRSLLIQLRLSEAPAQAGSGGKPRLLGVLISGMTFQGEQWRWPPWATGNPVAPTRPSRKWPKRSSRSAGNCSICWPAVRPLSLAAEPSQAA